MTRPQEAYDDFEFNSMENLNDFPSEALTMQAKKFNGRENILSVLGSSNLFYILTSLTSPYRICKFENADIKFYTFFIRFL